MSIEWLRDLQPARYVDTGGAERKLEKMQTRISELESALAAAKAQLPEEMQNFTILYKQCEKGHGWLTAKNWVQHGCPHCAAAAVQVPDVIVDSAKRLYGCSQQQVNKYIRDVDMVTDFILQLAGKDGGNAAV